MNLFSGAGARMRARLVFGGLAATVLGLVLFACGSDGAGDGETHAPSSTTPNAEPLFRDLQADLVTTCGGANGMCHVDGTYRQAPRWLGGADPYVTIKKYRGILPATKEVGDSILLTQVKHEGPALTDASNDLFRRVSDWLTAEVPGPPLPNTGAFSVLDGFNSVPLDTIATGLANARITFLATNTNGTLTLSALKLVAPPNANVKVASPFFVVLPRSGKVNADPDSNGFKGEISASAGQTIDLFSGQMILLRWDPTGRLKIAFETITSTPGQGAAAGCAALALFTSSALPAMSMPVQVRPDYVLEPDAATGGESSCLGCHAKAPADGEAPDPAVRAMDLRAASSDPAAACAQAKIWINLADKTKSTILLNPTAQGNPKHPMQPVDASDPIVQGIKAWVDAEH